MKEKLLRHYGSTEENYRKKFVEKTLAREEDPKSFFDSLTNALDKWLKCAKVEQSYEELRNFIIRDKAIHSLDKNLKAFIQERSPRNINEIVELIRNFKLAHPMAPTSKEEERQEIICFTKGKDNFQRGRSNSRSRLKCGICGRFNHSTRDCRYKRDEAVTCFICKKKGHLARNCTKRSSSTGNTTGRFSGNTDSNEYNANQKQGRGHCGAVLSRSEGVKFFPAFVGSFPVQAIRDTGSSVIGVHGKYVQPNQYTGDMAKCTSFDGRVITLRLAYINI